MGDLTHLDAEGTARMVDVGAKEVSPRRAVARAVVRMTPATAERVAAGDAPKGDVLDARNRTLEVSVADGRVVVLDTTDEDAAPEPLLGAAAHLDPDGLVVALPAALTGTVTVKLAVERSEISYSHDARLG